MSEERLNELFSIVDEGYSSIQEREIRDYITNLQQKVEQLETQQKEFINYLEKEIKRINPNDLYISELNLRLDDIKFTQYLIYKETLQKYKEITGVSDDKTN